MDEYEYLDMYDTIMLHVHLGCIHDKLIGWRHLNQQQLQHMFIIEHEIVYEIDPLVLLVQ